MQYDEFIGHVQKRTESESTDEAERVAGAILETLGERLTKKERENLADQLPGGLKGYLHRQKYGQPLMLGEFLEKVGSRAGLDRSESAKAAKAVLITVRQAVSPGEIEDVLRELPNEYHALFQAGQEEETRH